MSKPPLSKGGMNWAESSNRPRLVSYAGKGNLPKFIDGAVPSLNNSPAMAELLEQREVTTTTESDVDPDSSKSPRETSSNKRHTMTPQALLNSAKAAAALLSPRALKQKHQQARGGGANDAVKPQGLTPNAMIDGTLEEILDRERRQVPLVLDECANWIRVNAIDRPNLFRVPPNLKPINELVLRFERGTFSSFDTVTQGAEEVSSLFKLFLRRLPDPLTTCARYSEWIACVSPHFDDYQKVEALSLLVGHIKEPQQRVLRFVMSFLREVSAHFRKNKLDSHALATQFYSSLIHPPPDADIPPDQEKEHAVIFFLIERYARIFLGKKDGDVGAAGTVDEDEQAEEGSEAPVRRKRKKKRKKRKKKQPRPSATTTTKSGEKSQHPEKEPAAPAQAQAAPKTADTVPEEVEQESTDEEESDTSSCSDESLVEAVPQARMTIRLANDSKLKPPAENNSDAPKKSKREKRNVVDVFTPVESSSADDREGKGDSDVERQQQIDALKAMLANDPRIESHHSPVPEAEPPQQQTESAPSSQPKPKKKRKKKRRPKPEGAADTPETSTTKHHPPHPRKSETSTKKKKKQRRKRDRPARKQCPKCRLPVSGLKITALGQTFHSACFVCADCGIELQEFFECEGKPFCANDIAAAEEAAWGLFDESGQYLCGRCEIPVVQGKIVTALGKRWHSECFVCNSCECKLESYFGAGGVPFCEEHVVAAQEMFSAGKAKSGKKKPPASGPSVSSSKSSKNQSNLPVKRGPMLWLNKAKKRPEKSFMVLENQVLVVHREEPTPSSRVPPRAMLDLQQLRKIRTMESHLGKPFAIAITIGYDTSVVWSDDEFEVDDWVEALVHSNPASTVEVKRH